MKVQAQLYGPVYDTFVFIAYASSEGLDEPAHLRRVTTAFAARTVKIEGIWDNISCYRFYLPDYLS